MKMNRYNTEIRVETVKDAFRAGRLYGPAGKGMMKRSRDARARAQKKLNDKPHLLLREY